MKFVGKQIKNGMVTGVIGVLERMEYTEEDTQCEVVKFAGK